MMRNWILAVSLALVSSATGEAQQSNNAALKAQLLTMQPPAIMDLAQRLTAGRINHTPVPIDVKYVRASLDGTGKFNFIVAFFFTAQGGQDGYLRVFRDDNGVLTVAGDEEDPELGSGGGQAGIELVDVNGDGIPEVKVEGIGFSGAHTGFSLFLWTGSSLHLLTPNSVDAEDASLVDIDGDGQLEIVRGPYVDFNDPDSRAAAPLGPWDIYKLSGDKYVLSTTSGADPRGLRDTNGALSLVRVFSKRIEPGKFPLAEIHEAQTGQGDDDGRVVLILGNLRAMSGSSVSVEEINLDSLRLGQGLRPVATKITAYDGDADKDTEKRDSEQADSGPLLKVFFARRAVLAYLPHAQLDKPLAPGDTLTLPVRGKMKNGAGLSGTVTVKIVGEDDGKHHDKN
jgi:hypothetical protein